jgi:hypothetical protein
MYSGSFFEVLKSSPQSCVYKLKRSEYKPTHITIKIEGTLCVEHRFATRSLPTCAHCILISSAQQIHKDQSRSKNPYLSYLESPSQHHRRITLTVLPIFLLSALFLRNATVRAFSQRNPHGLTANLLVRTCSLPILSIVAPGYAPGFGVIEL